MMTQPATLFIYQHKRTHKTRCVYFSDSTCRSPEWTLVGTIDPAAWIEHVMNADEDEQRRAIERLKL